MDLKPKPERVVWTGEEGSEPIGIPDKPVAKAPQHSGAGLELINSIVQMSEEELFPWWEVQLPSLGVFNPDIPNGKLEVRPMGISAERILATQRLAASGKSIDLVLKKCVKFPPNFDMDDLLVGDKNFLFYILRGITYGPEYEFLFTCSDKQCKRGTTFSGDLRNVTVRPFDVTLGQEPYRVVLPQKTQETGHEVWVKVRFSRNSDSRAVMNQVQTSTMDKDVNVAIDDAVSENIARLIVEVGADNEGTSDTKIISAFIDKMHSRDLKTIDAFLSKNQPGVNSKVQLTCRHCSNEMTGELPITESFFRSPE